MKTNGAYINDFRTTLQNRKLHFTEKAISEPEANRQKVCFKLSLHGDHLPEQKYFVYVSDNGIVVIRTIITCDVAKEKATAMLLALNELNSQNCFVKFYLDEDRDVIGEYEVMVADSPENGKHIFQTLGICSIIVDSAIPKIFSIQWAEAENAAEDSDLLRTLLRALAEEEGGDANG